jgi:phosphoglycolate phosphatase
MLCERKDLGRVRHALFDFDGTLSLLREGWQSVMTGLMVEVFAATKDGAAESEIEAYIGQSTGIQTIFQMQWLAEEFARRGGQALEPAQYKTEYLNRLDAHIAARKESLRAGSARAEDYLVPGSEELLSELQRRGVRMYCASGTDEHYVREEAALLGLEGFFDGGIKGAQPDHSKFSKKMVIAAIIADNGLSGSELMVAGDGFVEIEECAAVGGVALGVATDERECGKVNQWKRERLIKAGADMIVADLSLGRELAALLCGGNES